MGDADGSNHVRMLDRDEEWLNEVVSELDDGLSRLISFMNVLNDHTDHVLSERIIWQKFRLCFSALNLFVIPVVISIVTGYISLGIVERDSQTEARLQTIISFLMFFSAFIGFPLYAFTLWNAYFADSTMEPRRTQSDQWKDAEGRISESGHDGSSLLVAVAEDSLEKLPEAQSRDAQTQTPMPPRNMEARESSKTEEATSREEKLVDLDSDYPSEAIISELISKELFEMDGIPVMILDTSREPTVEVDEGRRRNRQRSKLSEFGVSSPRIRDIKVRRFETDGSGTNDSFTKVDRFLPSDPVLRQEIRS